MSRQSILIVEDEGIVAEDLAGKVQQLGYDVAGIAATGEAAVELARSQQPALVLMDIRLAGAMDGIEAARVIRRECKLPALFLTAHSDKSTVARAKPTDAFGYILKPFDERDLQIQIEMALYKHAAEQRLRESEEQFRIMFEHSSVGMAQADPATGRYLRVNAALCRFTGYSEEELLGHTFFEVAHPEDREADLAGLVALAESKSTGCKVEKRHLRPDGTVVWGHHSLNLVLDEAGRPFRIMAVIQDITERKRAEEEREATVEFLRFLNECQGTRELIQAATQFFQRRSGCEAVGIRVQEEIDYPYYETRGFPEQFVRAETRLCARDKAGELILDEVGNPVLECMCGNVIRGSFDASKPFFTAKGSFWSNGTSELHASTTEADLQARTRNRCNGEGYESVALIPLKVGAEHLGLLQLNDRRKGRFTLESITLWERLVSYLAVALANFRAKEAIQRLNEDLVAVNRELETFSYSAAHDLRTPLRALAGFSEVLLEEYANNLDERGKSFLGRIAAAATNMGQLIEDLLNLSQITRAEMKHERVDLSAVARRITRTLAESSPERQVEFRLAAGLFADGDEQLFSVVLQNLFDNAWKFTRKNDHALIDFGVLPGEGERVYFVRDNGVGFDMTYAGKLFTPFQRFHKTGEFPGSGIGLATVKRIIERHGGRIWVEGRVGEGVTVYFTLE